MSNQALQPVSVVLLLGLLGVGKTATLQHLLSQRPKHERWAVLLNEFGALGVDQALLATSDVMVSQVSGGCLCCAAGPVTRVKLNQLLRQARPQRLLIEPSGVAHPHEILNLLAAPEYQGLLRLDSIITLLDPRHLTQLRHQNFPPLQEQIQVAHKIAFNKTDLCTPKAIEQAQKWLATQTHLIPTRVTHGQIPEQWWHVSLPEDAAMEPLPPPSLDWQSAPTPLSTGEWQQRCHQANGFYTLSWRIHAQQLWDATRLEQVLFEQNRLRIKGVVPTDQGWRWFNIAAGELSLGSSEPQSEAVIEFIEQQPINPDQAVAVFKPALIDSSQVCISTF